MSFAFQGNYLPIYSRAKTNCSQASFLFLNSQRAILTYQLFYILIIFTKHYISIYILTIFYVHPLFYRVHLLHP